MLLDELLFLQMAKYFTKIPAIWSHCSHCPSLGGLQKMEKILIFGENCNNIDQHLLRSGFH